MYKVGTERALSINPPRLGSMKKAGFILVNDSDSSETF